MAQLPYQHPKSVVAYSRRARYQSLEEILMKSISRDATGASDDFRQMLGRAGKSASLKEVSIAAARRTLPRCVDAARDGAIVRIVNSKRPGLANVVLISEEMMMRLATPPVEKKPRTLGDVLRSYPNAHLRRQRLVVQIPDDGAPPLQPRAPKDETNA